MTLYLLQSFSFAIWTKISILDVLFYIVIDLSVMIRIASFSLGLICIVLISGCGTSSKVDQFIQQADESAIITKPVSPELTVSNNQSDKLLLESSSDESDGNRWLYKDYTLDLLEQAKLAWQKVVIVVYDKTNDNCVKLDRDINMSLGRIPSDVIILKIEYTLAKELYQVKEMNTVIYLDATGKIINTSDGGIYTMDSLLYYL